MLKIFFCNKTAPNLLSDSKFWELEIWQLYIRPKSIYFTNFEHRCDVTAQHLTQTPPFVLPDGQLERIRWWSSKPALLNETNLISHCKNSEEKVHVLWLKKYFFNNSVFVGAFVQAFFSEGAQEPYTSPIGYYWANFIIYISWFFIYFDSLYSSILYIWFPVPHLNYLHLHGKLTLVISKQ